VVLAAKEGDTASAGEALEKLCRTYWPPLHAFIRREGYDETEAKDLTQEFFLKLIERDYLRHLRHQRGKFRSFILTLLKHFLLEQRGKAGAQKRGGGKTVISLEQIAEALADELGEAILFGVFPKNVVVSLCQPRQPHLDGAGKNFLQTAHKV
jgi:DNA-directed RNA polymerase specialized sigma24 family protein